MDSRVVELRIAALLVVALLLVAVMSTAAAGSYSKLVVFGDSLSDNGNLFALTGGAQPSDPPYFQGRHSNGPVWPQFLAASLGVPEENHAVSGARGDYTNVAGPYPGLRSEIDSYIGSTPWGADPDALYIVWAGSNDFLSLDQASAADAVRANLVSNVVAGVSDLVTFGVRHLAVVSLADLGSTPFANSASSPLTPSAFTAQSLAFNSELRAALDAASLPTSYIWMDAFSFSQTVTSNPAAYGFTNVVDSCLVTACTNPEVYLFYDDRHPSTAAHQVLADRFYAEIAARKLAGTTVHRVAGGNNDGEERAGGGVSLGSSDLELVYDGGNQTVGMRFTGVDVPQGATISNAYIQFQVDEVSTVATSLQIYGQAADNAPALQRASRNISNRPPTTSVAWNNVPGWSSIGAAGAAQRTPNLASVIEEIVGRSGWQAGNALLLVMTGTGERVAESYNGKASAAPLLHIEYGGGTATASAPVFNPGAGSFSSAVDVELTSTTGSAEIYYTLDGANPNPDGGSSTQRYTGAIAVTGTTTIKALARADGFDDSSVSTATYTVQIGGGAPVLAPIGNQTVTSEQTLAFAVTASDDNGAPLLSADLSDFPNGNQPSFTSSNGGGGTVNGNFSWTPQASDAGQTYSLVVTATDNTNSGLTDSASVDVSVLAPSAGATVEYRITSGDNDGEERAGGGVSLGSSDLELVYDGGNQTVGMRFTGVDVPQGATISNAYIQFQVDEVSTAATSLQIYGQAADNAPALQKASRNISNRPPTTSVAWNNVPGWSSIGAAGAAQRTPNLASVIEEIVGRSGWQAGNALLLVMTGTGERVAESYNGKASAAPLLHIEYGGGTATASAPVFNPGAGSFSSAVDVELTSTTGSAEIYYTLDGANPNPDGGSSTQRYTGAIAVTGTTTIKALARADGFDDSSVSTATYTVQIGGGAPVLAPIGNQTVTSEQTLAFAVTASDDNGAPLLSADLSDFPNGNQPSFTSSNGGGGTVNGNFSWTPQASDAGQTYSLVVTATDNTNSGLTDSASVDVSVLAPSAGATVEYRITSGDNDGEERAGGGVSLGSSDLELVYDGGNQTVGMRFTGVDVPQGATISNAYIQFQVDEVSTAATSLQIYGQAADNAPGLQNASRNISKRPPTTSVAWNNVPGWSSIGAAGAAQRTPNLASVIEEIVGRSGWQAGNALLLVMTGTGERVAESYNGKASAAPLLHIEYEGGNSSGGGGTPGSDNTLNLALYAFADVLAGGGSASAEEAIDGYVAQSGNGWVPGSANGASLQLDFDGPQSISKIVLADMTGAARVNQATIRLSDGQSLQTGALTDDGTPVEFPLTATAVTWVRVTIDAASGGSAGLGEIEVHADLGRRTLEYQDDFNDNTASGTWSSPNNTAGASGSADWVESNGRMTLRSSILGQTREGYNLGSYRVLSGYSHAGMDARLRVKTNSIARFGLMFAMQNANNYYRLSLSKQMSHVKLEKVSSGGEFSELAGSTQTFVPGEWTNLRIILDQGIIVVFMDGEHIVAAADSTFAGGQVALFGGAGRSYYDEPIHYDNLSILSAPTEPVLAIMSPVSEFAVFPDGSIPVTARVVNGGGVDAVRFSIDGGTDTARLPIVDETTPYSAGFDYGPLPPAPNGPGDHQLRIEALDSIRNPLAVAEATVRFLALGVNGINAVLVGDSISTSIGDDDSDQLGPSPDISADGRNSGGGFGPILNNELSAAGLDPVTVIQGAHPGDKASHGVDKVDAIMVRNPNASDYLVMYGSNDAYGSTPVLPNQYQANLLGIVSKLEATGANVYVATPPAVDQAVVGDSNRNATLRLYRDAVIDLVDDYSPTNGRVLHGPDFFTRFEASLGPPSSDDLLGADGLHPDGYGYAVMADEWRQCMEVGCDYL